jgi:hypothetical protein
MKPTKHVAHIIVFRLDSKPHDSYEIYKFWVSFELYSTRSLTNQIKQQISLLEHNLKKLWCKKIK